MRTRASSRLTPLTVMFAAAAFAGAGAARAGELSGTWQFKSDVANPVCHLTQTNDVVRGDCEGPAAKGPGFGVVEGQALRFTWQWVGKDNGVDGAFDFLGKIGADGRLSGELIGMVDTARGPFSATKQAAAR
jgi:hypothetical protein